MSKKLLVVLAGLLLSVSSVFAKAPEVVEPQQKRESEAVGKQKVERKSKPPKKSKKKKPRLGFEPFYWQSQLEGDITISQRNIPGTTIDFKDVLNLEEKKGIPEGELWLRTGKRSKLIFSYFEVEHKGQEVITQSFTYKGQTYAVGLDVSSRLKTQVGSFAYQFNFLQGKGGELGFLLGVKYLAFDTEIKALGIIDRQAGIEGLLPSVGLAGQLNFGKYLSWDTKVSGIGGNYSDISASLYDGWSRIMVHFGKHWGIGAGYRYFALNAKDDDNEANFTLSGPAAFLAARF